MNIAPLLLACLLSGIDPALEEAITALEENAAKITHGRATYVVEFTNPDGTLHSREQVEINFDQNRYAWVKGDWRFIRTPEYAISYHAHNLNPPPPPERARSSSSVLILSPLSGVASPWKYAPNTLSLTAENRVDNYPQRIELYLRQVSESADKTVTVVKERQHLLVTVTPSEEEKRLKPLYRDSKAVFELDESKGFTPTLIEYWGQTDGPYLRLKSSFKQVADKSWVAEEATAESWKVGESLREPNPTLNVQLVDVDLELKPHDITFTVDWIAPPIGTRIQDRIHRTEFLYGMTEIKKN